MRRDGKCEPHVHTGRVALYRRIKKSFDFGERYDLIEFAPDLTARHAEDRTVQIDVLAATEFGMEPGANLQQTCDASADLYATFRRLRDPRKDLQKGALSCAVSPDHTHDIATPDIERHIPQSPKVVSGHTLLGRLPVPCSLCSPTTLRTRLATRSLIVCTRSSAALLRPIV